jgi:hypothetical protein
LSDPCDGELVWLRAFMGDGWTLGILAVWLRGGTIKQNSS